MMPDDNNLLQPPPSPSFAARLRKNWRRLGVWLLILLMTLIIAAQTAIIIAQRETNRQIEAQSVRAMTEFLKSDPTLVDDAGTRILMKNVAFCWSGSICIRTDHLAATAAPFEAGQGVYFDDINSFMVNVHEANVLIQPKTLEGMFNESVFNYPGSNLRNLSVSITPSGNENRVVLNGNLKYLLWVPFEMVTNLSVDQKNNTLQISVLNLKVFGIIPATWAIKFRPINLDKLLTVPKNKHLTVSGNTILVKPFGLFPPPRINGQMSAISVTPTLIRLQFAGTSPDLSGAPLSGATNYIYLRGGQTGFGRLRMVDTQIQVVDANPDSYFRFALINYQKYLHRSEVDLREDGSVVVTMPDHDLLPVKPQAEPPQGQTIQPRPASATDAQDNRPSWWQRTRDRVKTWFN